MALTDDAIEAIRMMIVGGDLKPGDRLPRESDLAERLGLSRSSLREAVRALALIRVLTVRQGDGTYVSSLDPTSMMSTLSFVLDFQPPHALLEFIDLRRRLEPGATAQAATTMADQEIAELGTLVDALSVDTPVDELIAHDIEFHGRIAASSGNQVLCALLDTLSSRTRRARVSRGVSQDAAIVRTISEHRKIHLALAQRDPEAAKAWATVHITGVEDWVRETMADATLY